MKSIKLITEQDYAIYNTVGFYKVADLRKVSYDDLLRVFGEPTFVNPYSDEKVHFEWCFQYGNEYFTVYDWKIYSEREVMLYNRNWSVGGKSGALHFVADLVETIKWHDAIVLDEDWSNMDEFKRLLTVGGRAIFEAICEAGDDLNYMTLQELKNAAQSEGFTFDFGLDCVAYNFKASRKYASI